MSKYDIYSSKGHLGTIKAHDEEDALMEAEQQWNGEAFSVISKDDSVEVFNPDYAFDYR